MLWGKFRMHCQEHKSMQISSNFSLRLRTKARAKTLRISTHFVCGCSTFWYAEHEILFGYTKMPHTYSCVWDMLLAHSCWLNVHVLKRQTWTFRHIIPCFSCWEWNLKAKHADNALYFLLSWTAWQLIHGNFRSKAALNATIFGWKQFYSTNAAHITAAAQRGCISSPFLCASTTPWPCKQVFRIKHNRFTIELTF